MLYCPDIWLLGKADIWTDKDFVVNFSSSLCVWQFLEACRPQILTLLQPDPDTTNLKGANPDLEANYNPGLTLYERVDDRLE